MPRPIPKPRDPRTPLQAAHDRLAATRRLLARDDLPFVEVLQLAMRERQLLTEIRRLEAPMPFFPLIDEYKILTFGPMGEGKTPAEALLAAIIATGRKTIPYETRPVIGHYRNGLPIRLQVPDAEFLGK